MHRRGGRGGGRCSRQTQGPVLRRWAPYKSTTPIEETEESDRGESKGEWVANGLQRVVGGLQRIEEFEEFEDRLQGFHGQDAARSVVVMLLAVG